MIYCCCYSDTQLCLTLCNPMDCSMPGLYRIKHHIPCGSAGEESACNAGDLGLIPGLGRFPGEGKGYLLQYSGLENSTDYSPWGRKELGTTEQLSLSPSFSVVLKCVPWTSKNQHLLGKGLESGHSQLY